MRRIFLIAAACFFFAQSDVQGQTATINLKLDNEPLLAADKLECFWTVDNFEFYNGTPNLKDRARKDGNVFVISFEEDIPYRYITIKTGGKKEIGSILLQDFLIAPGDSIVMYRRDGKLFFKGKGSEKFAAQHRLKLLDKGVFSIPSDVNFASFFQDSNVLAKKLPSRFYEIVANRYLRRDSMLHVLKEYKSVLDEKVYNMLWVDIVGKIEKTLLTNLRMEFYRLSKEVPDLVDQKESFLRMYENRRSLLETLSSCDVKYSNEIQKYMVERMKNREWFDGFENDILFKPARDTEGMDRVLYRYFYRYYTKLERRRRMEIAYSIKNERYREAVLTFLNNIENGYQLPDFEFYNLAKKSVSLSDYAGTVLILDFWFTGCVNCKALHKEMKPIKEYFKTHDDVVFVSISIDLDIDRWKKSVESETYSDSTDVNLYTMGKGSEHKIIKFFNINSYPRQIVIGKELQVMATNIARPNTDASIEKLIKLIKDSL